MSNYLKNENGSISGNPPYKCKVCGLGNVENSYDVCEYCGWEDDIIQNEDADYAGGANQMSLNQYKQFWNDCKSEILNKISHNRFIMIDLSNDYYERHFKSINKK